MAPQHLRAAVAALALLPLAAAQAGYGRFPCTIVQGDGSFTPDQSKCQDSALTATGSQSGNLYSGQGEGVNPTNSVCTLEPETGSYFCGIAGAACTSNANCDNGKCVGGVCQGGLNAACGGDDTNCSGFLYCLGGAFDETASNTCGAIGAFCQDAGAADPSLTQAQAQAIFNQYCASGYCNIRTGNCDTNTNTPTTTTTTTTTTAATTTQAATTQAPTTAPPASSTHFTVSGAVSTSRPIASPVFISCDNSLAFNNCVKGAQAEYACCMSNGGTDNLCYASYKPNLANCYTAAAGNYACTSTSIPDVEACCLSVFNAYFGAGSGEGSSCTA